MVKLRVQKIFQLSLKRSPSPRFFFGSAEQLQPPAELRQGPGRCHGRNGGRICSWPVPKGVGLIFDIKSYKYYYISYKLEQIHQNLENWNE